MNTKHLGSNFDDFLQENGLLEHAEAVAIKRVISYQIEQEMKLSKVSKSVLAARMKTSLPALEKLLDPGNSKVTIHTLERAAIALGKKLKIELA
jgi:antitoxin HicB